MLHTLYLKCTQIITAGHVAIYIYHTGVRDIILGKK